MTNTGHDPNWRKLIRISFYKIQERTVHIRIEAIPLARTIFRIEKLKESWYYGLFLGLFSILQEAQEIQGPQEILKDQKVDLKTSYHCQNCGKKIDENMYYCTNCGTKLQ